MGKLFPGDTERLRGTFKDANGDNADPTTVKVIYQKPDGTEITKTSGTDAEVVKQATGDYYIDIILDKAGIWCYRWEGTGNVTTAEEETFTVRESFVETLN